MLYQSAPSSKNYNELLRQLNLVEINSLLLQTLNALNIMVLILNSKKEIIFINDFFKRTLGIQSNDQILGKRFGELLKCKNYNSSEYGCGYVKECEQCAANNVMAQVINTGQSNEANVSITSVIEGMSITSVFKEKVTELNLDNEKYYMIALVDKSAEADKANLEKIFFHDILNTASGLYNVLRLIRLENENYKYDEEFIVLENYIKTIIDDIEYHRNVMEAEKNDLAIHKEEIDINKLVEECIQLLQRDERFHKIQIHQKSELTQQVIISDRIILRRIVINMIKNALEASKEYESVYVTIKDNDNQCIINISNNKVIPYKMQDKIFNKGYSTKGNGRGLGTYGSKLLINKYLNGNITFSSGKDIGTTFSIILPKEV